MRTTLNSTYAALRLNLSNTSSRLSDLYQQASTGTKVSKASDAPSSVNPILQARSQITASDRYMENIAKVQDDLDILDGYLGTAQSILTRVKEIAVAGIDSALSEEDLAVLGEEVGLLREEMLDIANAKVDGKYLFAGYSDITEPFSGDPVVYGGTSDHKFVETSSGRTTQCSLTGDELFMDPVDIFTVLSDLEDALAAGDSTAIAAQLDNIDAGAEQISGLRSRMGNINARLDDDLTQCQNLQLQMEEVLSRHEDADLTEVLSSMVATEQAFQAALEVTSRVSQLSILNYIYPVTMRLPPRCFPGLFLFPSGGKRC